MDEVEINAIEDYDTWLSLNVAARAEILGEAIMLSQTDPQSMADGQWFALGMALNDRQAVEFINAASIQENGAWDFEDASTYEAAVSAYRRYNQQVGPAKSRRAQEAMLAGINATGATKWQSMWKEAFVGGIVAPFVVAGVTAAPAIGYAGAMGGLAPATAAAGAAATPGAFQAVRMATTAAVPLGQGARWLTNTSVGRIASRVADRIYEAHNLGIGSDQLLKQEILRVGPSGFAHNMRLVTSVFRYGSYSTAGIAGTTTALDNLRAVFASESQLLRDEELREEQVSVATLEKQGYEVSRDGVILAAGEEIYLADEGVTIKDSEGNIVSAEEVAEATGDAPVPDPFAGETDEAPEFGADVPNTGENEVFGAADQYRNAPSTGDASMDAYLAGLTALMGGAAEPEEEEPTDWLAVQNQQDPFLGPVGPDYRRSSYGADPEMNNQADEWARMGVPYSVTEAQRKHGTPTYRTSDPNKEMMNMTGNDLIQFQQDAIDAGLIDPENSTSGYFRFGQLDGQTFGAMETAMAQANVNGENQTWQDALDGMIVNREAYMEKFGDGSEAPATWTPPRAYFAPDYASISQTVKATFGQQLGREPNGWEMELLADQFRSDHRAQYDAEMAGSRAAFEANGRAQESGIIETPADQQAIDPVARMQESFDTTFSDELDAKSRWADVKSKSRNLFGSLNKLGGA